MLTTDGRQTLFDGRLIVHAGADTTTLDIPEADIPALLRDRFGIEPPAA